MGVKHGEASYKNHPGSTEYGSWQAMKSRCYQPSSNRFARYGARGIRVCGRWLGEEGFQNFLADMGRKPTPQHSLERRDNDKDYSPDNCEWATAADQARNRSTSKLTQDDVDLIRGLLELGMKKKLIALRFGVTRQLIRRIEIGKAWK